MQHRTIKSSTNLVFISRLNAIVDGSKVGCCCDEVHVVVRVIILCRGWREVGGWVPCCAHVNVHHGCACVTDRLHQEEQEHTYNILPLYTC